MKDFIKKIIYEIKNLCNNSKISILIIATTFLGVTIAYSISNPSLHYNNKKLILKEPTKITSYLTFKELCESGQIETVYYKNNKDTLLFTVKDNSNVKQIDYKHNKMKDIYKKEKFNDMYRKNFNKYKDKCLLVYKSFNPQKEDFREFLLKNNIQIIDVTERRVDTLSIFSTIIYIVFVVVILKSMNIGKSDENEEIIDIPNVKFTDIEGNEEAKEEMKIIVDFLENPKKYEDMGAKIPKGVILYGPPGTGKTLLAKAIAGEAKVPFFNKSASDFVEVYVGVGAKRVRNLFKKARKKAPCIIFIDEIDSIGSKRGVSKNDEKDQTLNKLLVELDGFKSSERIIVIAATNRIDMLDNALTRSGRFDKHIPIELPNKKDRLGILRVHFKNKKIADNVSLENIAEVTAGFSGADIAVLANESAIIACVKNHKTIELEDIDEAYIKTAMQSNPKKDLTNRNEEQTKIIAYHEAGHTVVAKLLGNNVHKVSIIGTTSGAGGFTATTNEENNLLSKNDFEKEIKIILAGRAAEYLLFEKNEEKITMGAVNDIERATSIITSMIKEYGMIIKSDSENDNKKMYSPFKISNKNDSKIQELGIKEATKLYKESIKILEENKEILDRVAKELIEKETLSSEEVNLIMSEYK